MNDKYDPLKLDNQLCFPLYATSRLIVRAYQPFLNKLNLTYPQYLVLMVLWEEDAQPVNDIAKKLILNTNTITPLLKRMETLGLISRTKSSEDERKVIVLLSEKGKAMKEDALKIPEELKASLKVEEIPQAEMIALKQTLQAFIAQLQ
ncbi:MarR family transcriptional regulator [Persicobacter psychrovividus]|uniref:HTH-type transcriptional regulator SarZ n=1 Tax=Persicobacter psychrovividus TaxID=387638 RepID=A0ABM7VHQ3_9BACT|nr:hypothetical protein PEPS_27890 [Persicobacter psychrovividus]